MKNLKGQKFGNLLVMEFSRKVYHAKTKRFIYYWKCKCDCGNEKEVRDYHLTYQNHTQSCGCLRESNASIVGKGNILPSKESKFRILYRNYKKRALNNYSFPFSLPYEQFLQLITQTCFYCGTSASNKIKNRQSENNTWNGIDRIDSNRGYEINNVVACCTSCNVAKNAKSQSNFYEWVKRLHSNLLQKGLLTS